MKIHKPIPSYLRFGKVHIVLKHQGQEETCRHCNLPGHYAHSCNQEICYNCDTPGHQARTCPRPILCSICHSNSQSQSVSPLLVPYGELQNQMLTRLWRRKGSPPPLKTQWLTLICSLYYHKRKKKTSNRHQHRIHLQNKNHNHNQNLTLTRAMMTVNPRLVRQNHPIRSPLIHLTWKIPKRVRLTTTTTPRTVNNHLRCLNDRKTQRLDTERWLP